MNASSTSDADAQPLVYSRGKISYHSLEIQGLSVFYREAGPRDAPVVLLLHGFPSSSRMWEPLLPLLSDRHRLIAPDYPGFGHSACPTPSAFDYSFDRLADMMNALLHQLGISHYVLCMQDYGGPVGFRMALSRPERVEALIVLNAVAHEEGLGPLWEARRKYWANPEGEIERLKANFLSLESTRLRHVGTSPNIERYNPDAWIDEYSFLSRPGQAEIQAALFLDYRTNVSAYPRWGQWLRDNQPPLLVVWGRYDPSFNVAGAFAYARDVRGAEIHILEAGHFALDEAADDVVLRVRAFLERLDTTAQHR